MELESLLKEQSPDLYEKLTAIKATAEAVWKTTRMQWFTNHDPAHSREIIYLLGQILKPIEKTDAFLNKEELFILLSSAYLHDVGMQYLNKTGKITEELEPKEYNEIRKNHADESYNFILKRGRGHMERNDHLLPHLQDDFL